MVRRLQFFSIFVRKYYLVANQWNFYRAKKESRRDLPDSFCMKACIKMELQENEHIIDIVYIPNYSGGSE